jgi:hypothetical protein
VGEIEGAFSEIEVDGGAGDGEGLGGGHGLSPGWLEGGDDLSRADGAEEGNRRDGEGREKKATAGDHNLLRAIGCAGGFRAMC